MVEFLKYYFVVNKFAVFDLLLLVILSTRSRTGLSLYGSCAAYAVG